MDQIIKLQQEHAIYKAFYQAMRNRPVRTEDATKQTIYRKAAMFDVIERLERLDDDVLYYDPAWEDADKNLFILND